MRLRCCLARRRASFSSSVDLRPLHAGMYEEGSASAGRLEDDGKAGDDTDDETELGLREPLLPDSVHTSNVGSMTVVISADIVEGIKSFSTYACTETRVCFNRETYIQRMTWKCRAAPQFPRGQTTWLYFPTCKGMHACCTRVGLHYVSPQLMPRKKAAAPQKERKSSLVVTEDEDTSTVADNEMEEFIDSESKSGAPTESEVTESEVTTSSETTEDEDEVSVDDEGEEDEEEEIENDSDEEDDADEEEEEEDETDDDNEAEETDDDSDEEETESDTDKEEEQITRDNDNKEVKKKKKETEGKNRVNSNSMYTC